MDELTLECLEKTNKTVEALKGSFATIRTGRANASLLDRIEADYYGDKMPINQIASVTVPEPRQLLIKPYDRNDLKAILSAIAASDIGINPINDGGNIRLIMPPLTEDRRRDFVKMAKKFTEETKVAIRNIRHDYFDFLKQDDSYSDDLKERIQGEIQKVVDEAIKKVDDQFVIKEKEIMVV